MEMADILIATAAFLVAGTVKGVLGIGLPTTAIGLLTIFWEPRAAIAVTVVPMLVTNAWQVWRQGETVAAIRRYRIFASVLVAGVLVTVLVTAEAPESLIAGVLGLAILAFVAVQVTPWAPRIPDRLDRPAQAAGGLLAGILGGLTAVWAPPVVLYLAARRAPKEEFVRATGLLFMLGSVPLVAGYLRLGFLQPGAAVASTLLLAPAMAGFALGERLRHTLSEIAFRRALLVFFCLMGLNLLRKALG